MATNSSSSYNNFKGLPGSKSKVPSVSKFDVQHKSKSKAVCSKSFVIQIRTASLPSTAFNQDTQPSSSSIRVDSQSGADLSSTEKSLSADDPFLFSDVANQVADHITEEVWSLLDSNMKEEKYGAIIVQLNSIFHKKFILLQLPPSNLSPSDACDLSSKLLKEQALTFLPRSVDGWRDWEKNYVFSMIDSVALYKQNCLLLSSKLEKSDHPFLKRLLPEDVFLLFIDSIYNPSSPFLFDASDNYAHPQEHGYIGALIGAFSKFLPTKDSKIVLSVDFIKSLYHEALSKDHQLNNPLSFGGREIIFSKGGDTANLSDKGELYIKQQLKNPDSLLYDCARIISLSPSEKSILAFKKCTPSEMEGKLNSIITDFNVCMSKAQGKGQKKTVIVRFIQNLIHAQPFPKGNVRTFACLLMNLLFLQERIMPVIWDNPNVLEGFALDECVDKVTKGQTRFIQLVNDPFWYG